MSAVDLEFETFSLEEVGEMHGVSADWLRRRITNGETPAVLGTHWRMTRSDIATLVEQMREAAQRKVAELADGTDGRAKRRAAAKSTTDAEPTTDAGLSPRTAARMKRRKTDAA
ncbi:hypothetical protein [Nocardia sp. NPDC055049]